ncbi:MAG TPA: hypothetical protein VG755_16015 [Nannocystaceae bacterium]|nr:hypothetical protein [Nannocystaceae bacterium]
MSARPRERVTSPTPAPAQTFALDGLLWDAGGPHDNASWQAARMRCLGGVALLSSIVACGDASETELSTDEATDCAADLVPLFELEHVFEVYAVEAASTHVISWSRRAAEDDLTSVSKLDFAALDGCGMPPRMLVENVQRYERPPRADVPWFFELDPPGEASFARWWIDVLGDREPVELATGRNLGWSERGGLVMFDREERRYAVVELTMDGDGRVHERVLATDLGSASALGEGDLVRHVVGTRSDGVTVAVDVDDGALDVVATGNVVVEPLDREARCFRMRSSDARGRDQWVHDRRSGGRIALGRADWTEIDVDELDGAVVVVAAAETQTRAETQIVLVPELRELWWPAGGTYDDAAVAPDGTRVFVGEQVVLRLDAGAEYPVALSGIDADALVHGSVEVHFGNGELWIAAHRSDSSSYTSPTWWYRAQAGVDEVVPLFDVPVLTSVWLGRDRAAYVVGEHSGAAGELWLHDSVTGEHRFIANDVAPSLRILNAKLLPAVRDGVRTELLFRTGFSDSKTTVWRARL